MEAAIISLFTSHFGKAPTSTQLLHSAGSNRVYLRLFSDDGTSVIGAFGSNVQENAAFIYLSRHFTEKGLPVPHIYAASDNGLCYLQSDLGDLSLHQALSPWKSEGYVLNSASQHAAHDKALLEETLRLLAHLQIKGGEGLDVNRLLSPNTFNKRAVMFDLNYFKYCFLKLTGLPFDEVALEDDFEHLTEQLLQCDNLNSTFLYRDFQARNVMVVHGKPAFIDFQGGRKGPLHYDVASFLWQASAQYPHKLRQQLVEVYLDELSQLVAVDTLRFQSELQLFVLFRMLQVLGAYGLRGLYEKKDYFIHSIPLALQQSNTLLEEGVADNYPQLKTALQSLIQSPLFQ